MQLNLARTELAHKYRFSYSRQCWIRLNEPALEWIFALTDCFCTVKGCVILRFECLVCLWSFRIHTDMGIFKRYLGINGFWIAYYSWCQHEWMSDFVTAEVLVWSPPKVLPFHRQKYYFQDQSIPKMVYWLLITKSLEWIPHFSRLRSHCSIRNFPFSLLNQNTCHLVTVFNPASFSTSQHTRANQNKAIEKFSWWAVVNEWTLAEISASHPENIFYYYWKNYVFQITLFNRKSILS